MKVFSSTYGLMYSHYDGLFPMFSPGDILFFNQWVNYVYSNNQIANPSGPIPPLNNLYFTLVTSNGNYMLRFDASIAPVQFPTDYSNSLDDLNKVFTKMASKSQSVANVSGDVSFDMDKLEKEFLKFAADHMNMQGMKLYKTESNGTNTEIYLENGNRKTKKCP